MTINGPYNKEGKLYKSQLTNCCSLTIQNLEQSKIILTILQPKLIYQRIRLLRYPVECPLIVFSFQGGTVAIMCAMERPHFFTGIVLSAPAILANPETATRFMVNQALPNKNRIWFLSLQFRQRPNHTGRKNLKRGFISSVIDVQQ